jgi:hypothetical protein
MTTNTSVYVLQGARRHDGLTDHQLQSRLDFDLQNFEDERVNMRD